MTCYLNGDFLPLEDAKIPVLDRGFIYGDGVYEVVPVYGRRPFRLQAHLARLARSLDAVRIAAPRTDAQWHDVLSRLIASHPADDQSVYLQVTRGVAKRDHAFPRDTTPTVFAMTNPLSTPSAQQIEHGVAAVTAVDNRWGRCDIKSTALLANVLLRQFAVDHGAAETVLLRDGRLTEGAASNILIVSDGTVLTPPPGHELLAGVTLDVIAALAAEAGMRFATRDIFEADLRGADEIWLTSASREVLAITTLDGAPVGNGSPGPMFRAMHACFQAAKRKA